MLFRSRGAPTPGRRFTVPADFVLVATGFDADMSLFRSLGGTFNEDGTPKIDPVTMESEVPGVYLAGTAANGEYPRYSVFVGTAHHHAEGIVGHILGGAGGNGPGGVAGSPKAAGGSSAGMTEPALRWATGAPAGRRYEFDNEDIRTH